MHCEENTYMAKEYYIPFVENVLLYNTATLTMSTFLLMNFCSDLILSLKPAL